ncbi:hypothetical protein GDO78_017774 [Eleutherodactylus coqui]|uniref:Uncharacterized protein n=1 Tax=Eleutherodactylus coqui TaxID=57060 RepID=A0A8J6EPU9_ELECQ|nr:hypothetical protein GDO78_017774 [Eleutherodactylus coqui]
MIPFPIHGATSCSTTKMLSSELSKTTATITEALRQQLSEMRRRLDSLDSKVDSTVSRVNQNSKIVAELQECLEAANMKIKVLENRSRREDFRIRGLPESITDVPKPGSNLLTMHTS